MTSKYCMIMTTTGSQEDAEKLANLLVTEKLAACVQILPIQSYYNWKGDLQKDDECLLFIKTRTDLYSNVEAFIKDNHSYEIPEIIQIPIIKGYSPYLGWIDKSTKNTD